MSFLKHFPGKSLPSFFSLIMSVQALANAGPGGIVANTNLALPKAYNFLEYQFPEPADSKACKGATNATAILGKVFFAQTHVMEPSWPLFFLIAKRPALIQVIITGSGTSPDVSVQGLVKGVSVGSLCLNGPATLPAVASATEPRFDDRFSSTLPASWMQPGLSLVIKAGPASKTFTEAELKLGAAPELNLVMLPFDILDWNTGKTDKQIPASFMADFSGAMPASKLRLGNLASRMVLPTLAVSSDTSTIPVVLETKTNLKGIPDGNINAVALRYVEAVQRACGDFSYTYYYGNTENFDPGGWGGGNSFVGADFTGVFLHEMGHALSLPHWGEGSYQVPAPGEGDYSYPYGGTTNDGGGRGDTWNYYQNLNEFISPICGLVKNKEFGKERSDAMQRNHWCQEFRAAGEGPWDGFGDFSALSMYHYMVGFEKGEAGTVPYKGAPATYHLPSQTGFPTLKLDGTGKRILERANQPLTKQYWEQASYMVPDKWDTPVYTIYGSYHPQYTNVNILYEPMAYIGNLVKLIDPTNPATFTDLAAGGSGSYGGTFYGERDLTFKFTYADGSVLTALYPYGGVSRNWKAGTGPWRSDMMYFAINIPADKKLTRIELYKRLFVVRGSNDTTSGNIANPKLAITAGNFMTAATLVMSKDVHVNPPIIGIKGRNENLKSNLLYRLTSQGVEFTGLQRGAILDIYTARGKLLKRIRERGGVAVWQQNSDNGKYVGTGLFFARTWDGEGQLSSGTQIMLTK